MGSKHRRSAGTIIVAVVAVIFFCSSLMLANPHRLFISPDETANAYFTQLFSESGSLIGEYDELVAQFDNRIHPRSTVSQDGRLYPGSFLGLPVLYGVIVAVLGIKIIWFLTPFFTLLAAFALKQLVGQVCEHRVAILSFVLFLLHPAVWYYSARGLMHNVLFVDLLIFAFWFWVIPPIKNKTKHSWTNDAITGLLVGLALFVRTAEFSWVLLSILALLVVFVRHLPWKRLMKAGGGLTAGFIIIMLSNTLVFGGPLTTGYTFDSPQITSQTIGVEESVDSLVLFPFGFHPHTTWDHFSVYFGSMFWWLAALAVVGLFVLISKYKHRARAWGVLAVCIGIFVWLGAMYGSWEIHDNPDPTQITMANSYVRYWLPLYVLTVPLIALAIEWFASLAKTTMAKRLGAGIILLVIVFFNFYAVFSQGQDGLLKVYETLKRSGEIQSDILFNTESSSLFIVDRADKLFFPHRRVWYPLRDDETYDALPLLVETVPVYYYGITFPQEDMDYLNNSRLGDMELGIELIETYDQESLYQIFAK